MNRFERNVVIVSLSLFVLYWSYRVLLQPRQISYPTIMGSEMNNMIIWKTEKVKAPIPKFIDKFKERLWEVEDEKD